MGLKLGLEGVYWFHFAEDKLLWRASVPSVVKLRLEWNPVAECQSVCAAWTWLSYVGLCGAGFCCVVMLLDWLSFVSVVSWIWFALAGCNHTVLYRHCNILTCMLHWDTPAESVAGVWRDCSELMWSSGWFRCRHFEWTEKNKRLVHVVWNWEKAALFTADWVAFRALLPTVAKTLQNKWHSN